MVPYLSSLSLSLFDDFFSFLLLDFGFVSLLFLPVFFLFDLFCHLLLCFESVKGNSHEIPSGQLFSSYQAYFVWQFLVWEWGSHWGGNPTSMIIETSLYINIYIYKDKAKCTSCFESHVAPMQHWVSPTSHPKDIFSKQVVPFFNLRLAG